MKIGFARSSNNENFLEIQIDALKKEGCQKVFIEKSTTRNNQFPKFEEMMRILREGDTLIVHSLARLGRTPKELIKLLHELNKKGVEFKSLKDLAFDTSTSFGNSLATIWSDLIDMEAIVLSERNMKGLESARASGKKVGRPKGTIDNYKYHLVLNMYKSGASWSEIQHEIKISRSTISNYLKKGGLL